MKLKAYQIISVSLLSTVLLMYQNCSQSKLSITDQKLNGLLKTNEATVITDNINPSVDDGGGTTLDVCQGISCDLNPLTTKPAVTTVLLALGDKANQQLVVNGASSQLIAETIIRYSTPKKDPKILVVQDQNISGEDPEDTVYLLEVLLSRYDVKYIIEPVTGLSPGLIDGFDLIWFNNPGHPMTSIKTRDELINFKGAVVLQGDDLSRGKNFSLEALTGLKYVDNGTTVVCGEEKFLHDDNLKYQYRVSLNSEKIPFADLENLQFKYGNDIDNTVLTNSKTEILASAVSGDNNCSEKRPAIVRHFKD